MKDNHEIERAFESILEAGKHFSETGAKYAESIHAGFDNAASTARRILECLMCPYHDKCSRTVENPEDYSNGNCKTKAMFDKEV